MQETNGSWYRKGLRVGIPIGLGYFAVAFSLGIAAKQAGFTAFQAGLASAVGNASAGEFAAFTLVAAGATYLEMAMMTMVANARYLLMSCALSQKLPQNIKFIHRLILGFYITDEYFGVAISVPGKLNPWYSYGVISVAAPAWAMGTYFGVLMGNVLPIGVVSALSVSLYGMFLAIIIPPAKKDKVVAVLVVLSMLASFLASRLPIISGLSSGMRIILLTVVISLGAAVLFPVKEEMTDET